MQPEPGLVTLSEYLLNRALGSRNFPPGSDQPEPGARFIRVSGIEGEPVCARFNDMADVPFILRECTNRLSIPPDTRKRTGGRSFINCAYGYSPTHRLRKSTHRERLTYPFGNCISTNLWNVFYQQAINRRGQEYNRFNSGKNRGKKCLWMEWKKHFTCPALPDL